MLSLLPALELYSLLKPYLPEDEDTPAVDYMQGILKNMLSSSGGEDDYAAALELMGADGDDPLTALVGFGEGLAENEITAMKDMLGRLGM